jgi:hypothetical protein
MVYQAKNKDSGGGIEIKLRDKSQTVKVTRSARSFVESILSIDSRASLSLSLFNHRRVQFDESSRLSEKRFADEHLG